MGVAPGGSKLDDPDYSLMHKHPVALAHFQNHSHLFSPKHRCYQVRPHCPRRSGGVLLAPCADGRTRRKQGSQRTGTLSVEIGYSALSSLP
jgi:hypothetical protein